MRNGNTDLISKHNELISLLEQQFTPEVWSIPIENLKALLKLTDNNPNSLARYDIALSKWFDYYPTPGDVKELVTEIVLLSMQLFKLVSSPSMLVKICGQHEDGACFQDVLGPRCGTEKSNVGWPLLPQDQAINFKICPEPKLIVPGSTLYRVLSHNGNVKGTWWFFDYKISSRREWRSRFAIIKAWNPGTHFVKFKIDTALKVWIGSAASQQSTNECILWGGSNQVWVDLSLYQITFLVLTK